MSLMHWNTSQVGRRAKNDVKVCTQNNAFTKGAQWWIPEKGGVLED